MPLLKSRSGQEGLAVSLECRIMRTIRRILMNRSDLKSSSQAEPSEHAGLVQIELVIEIWLHTYFEKIL